MTAVNVSALRRFRLQLAAVAYEEGAQNDLLRHRRGCVKVIAIVVMYAYP